MAYQLDWSVVWTYRSFLFEGLQFTLLLFFAGTLAALTLGLMVGLIGTSRYRMLRALSGCYVEVIRNIPLVVKIFFLYFGCNLSAFEAAIIGLGLHQSAYLAEIFRSGIQSVSRNQTEAGLSTGLSNIMVLRRIILPQALTIVIPPTLTQIVEVLKNSSIAMTIGIQELTFQIRQIESETFRGFEAAAAATLGYLIIALILVFSAYLLERKLTGQQYAAVKVLSPLLPPGL